MALGSPEPAWWSFHTLQSQLRTDSLRGPFACLTTLTPSLLFCEMGSKYNRQRGFPSGVEKMRCAHFAIILGVIDSKPLRAITELPGGAPMPKLSFRKSKASLLLKWQLFLELGQNCPEAPGVFSSCLILENQLSLDTPRGGGGRGQSLMAVPIHLLPTIRDLAVISHST